MHADDEVLDAELIEPIDLDKVIAERAMPVRAEIVFVKPMAATAAPPEPAAQPTRWRSPWLPDWALLAFLVPFSIMGLTLWLVIA